MNNRIQKGSETAKQGFKNENDVVLKFNNWKTDHDSKKWLILMGYEINEIQYVKAELIHGEKSDIQIQITIKLTKLIESQNLQVKLVSNKKGFNQIDKRWIDNYKKLWEIPDDIIYILKRYTGEIEPNIQRPIDSRRMFLFEFSEKDQNLLMSWLEQNKSLIVSDILKGRGKFAAEWMLVIQKLDDKMEWVFKPMNYCLNHFGNGGIVFTKRGNIKIGKITMQRKGGDGGRETSKMLQFKINPIELFE